MNVDGPIASSKPLFSMESSADGVIMPIGAAPPMWKSQEFKAPACVKQNKVMQSCHDAQIAMAIVLLSGFALSGKEFFFPVL